MATCSAPDDVPDKATVVCAVCLEPFKGRNPKLLPCSHTFCLPCLKDLEMHHMAKCSEDGNKEKKFTSTFPCPSCRAVIQVPAGGVAELQATFDLNQEPLNCKVCDQPRKAVYICSDCCHTMCAQCQRCHEKFTSNHRIQPLTSRCTQSSRNTSLPKSVEAITDHLTVLEAALVTMREEEDTLQREMLAVADVISKRADVMRALVTQAERNSQRALAELANKQGKKIQEEMISAREKQTVILQLLEHSSTGRQSPDSSNEILIRFLLKKEDYQYYRQRNKSKRLKFLIPQFIDSAIDEQDISSYIGTVSDSNQYQEETNDSPIWARKCGEAEAAIKIQSDMQEGTSSSEQQVPDTTASGMYKRSLSLAELASDITAVKSQLMGMQTFISSFCIMHTDKRENDVLEKQLDNLKARFYRIEEDMMRTKSNIVTFPENLEVLKKKLLIIDKKILGIQLEVQNLESNAQKVTDEKEVINY